jgi:hypothetical protein
VVPEGLLDLGRSERVVASAGRGWRTTDAHFAVVLAITFFCVTAVGIAHHEMWRDEWQAWLIARESGSLLQLHSNLGDEGHPIGWYLILFLLSRFTRDPLAMQAVHLVIATASVFLLARFAPLSQLHRGLLAFSYFLAFEYAIVARSYALGVLALFAFCSVYPLRRRYQLLPFLPLILLATASIHGFLVSVAASGMLLLEALIEPKAGASSGRRVAAMRIGLLAWLGAIVLTLVLLRPEVGFLEYAVGRAKSLSLGHLASTLGTVARAYVPLPDPGAPGIWNTHVIAADTRAGLAALALLACALLGAGVLLFLRRPYVLFLYLGGTAGMLLFRHLIFAGTLRHHGHLFILFIACLWLTGLPGHEWRLPPWLRRWTGLHTRFASAFVLAVLLTQSASAAIFYVADLRGPFTAAPQVVDFIRAHGMQDALIAANAGALQTAISGHLDRPIHHVAMDTAITFIRWRRVPPRGRSISSMQLFRPLFTRADSVLLILQDPFDDWDPDLDVTELGRFPRGIERSERFVLYQVRRTAKP